MKEKLINSINQSPPWLASKYYVGYWPESSRFVEPHVPLPYSQKPAILSLSYTKRIQATLPYLISSRYIFALPFHLRPLVQVTV
jgi:hypothetical protein